MKNLALFTAVSWWLCVADAVAFEGEFAVRQDVPTGYVTSLQRVGDADQVEFIRPGASLGPVSLRVRSAGAPWREVDQNRARAAPRLVKLALPAPWALLGLSLRDGRTAFRIGVPKIHPFLLAVVGVEDRPAASSRQWTGVSFQGAVQEATTQEGNSAAINFYLVRLEDMPCVNSLLPLLDSQVYS